MKVGLTMGLLGILGLAGCGGASGGVTVNGGDSISIRIAPAGTSLMVFLDLEGLRPDQVQAGIQATLPECVLPAAAGGSTTFRYNQCKAANTGVLTGTVTVTGPVAGTGAIETYTEAFNLTVTTTLPDNATQVWNYTGSQLVSFNGAIAKVALANPLAPIQAVYRDSATPANDITYEFTPNLTEDTSDPSRLTMAGGFNLVGSDNATITCAIVAGSPLVWLPAACTFPSSGNLTLSLAGGGSTDQTAAAFGSGCGLLDLGGALVPLGGS
jgi:hypothetical protein